MRGYAVVDWTNRAVTWCASVPEGEARRLYEREVYHRNLYVVPASQAIWAAEVN